MGTTATTASTATLTQSTKTHSPSPQLSSSSNSKNKEIMSTNSSSWQLFEFDMEALENSRWIRACAAGSIAGLTEHSTLYPIDTVKTRMQAVLLSHTQVKYKSFIDAFTSIIKNERPRALFRGYPAVITAAIPSHAAYFGAYEYSKYRLHASNNHHPFLIAISGAFATMAHDAFVTPFDVIKQRMQLRNCPYANICKCAIETFRHEGYLSFFRSYPTTVLLNIPVFSTNFVIYESTKIALKDSSSVLADEENWSHHLMAGGLAGACAGLISNPLDVIKTAIQTDTTHGYKSLSNTIRNIMATNPHNKLYPFFSGASARILYMIPSAAITWTTYEAMKTMLGFPIHDIPMI